MALTPKLPPGRSSRKALAYADEIQRLRASGYSFDAIRRALLDAGLDVSLTTVKREAAKRPVATQTAPLCTAPSAATSAHAAAPEPSQLLHAPVAGTTSPASFAGDARSGREIVDAFMQGRSSNPLMRQRTSHEDRSA